METISPGLNPADTTVFHSILRDVFSGIPMVKELFAAGSAYGTPTTNGAPFVPSSHSLITTTKQYQNLEAAITQACNFETYCKLIYGYFVLVCRLRRCLIK